MKQKCYSVALCTYNGEKYIEDQLNSILNQSVLPCEIIISDDGSNDNTLILVNNILKKSNIFYRIVKNYKKKGVTANFSNAISLCTGEYIFTSDQDDVWMSNKAESIINIFESNSKALLVFSNGELVDQDLHLLHCAMWESVGITTHMLRENKWFEYLLNRCLVTGAAMAFRRELFQKDEMIPSSWLHDGWLAWKAVAKDGLVPCEEKLILYRQHGNNVVGMNNVTLKRRIKKYIRNFKNIQETHIIRYQRYKDLETYLSNNFSDVENNKLQNCILFWKDMVNSDKEKSRFKKLKIIIEHVLNGDFDKYFNGKKGALREILLALFY